MMVRHIPERELHGESNTLLWGVWSQMIQRCYCTTCNSYRWYGAKGIQVCDDWKRYTHFRDWALANGYKAGLTIDRTRSDGDYEPSNCTWMPRGENARKSATTRWLVTAFGETKTIGQWLHDERCKPDKESTIRMRLTRGWDAEKAITTPSKPYHYAA